MLDRTDFATWQQCIRLYCRGNKNGILKSIDEGPFKMEMFRKTLPEGEEGTIHLGLERPRVYSNLLPKEKYRYNADIHATNILLHGLPKDIYTLVNHFTDAKDIWDNVKILLEGSELTKEDCELQLGAQNRVKNANLGQARQIKCYNYNALNVDNVFQADDCDAFDSDVDEALTAQTTFMANLSFVDPVYDETGSSYDSDILSEVHGHDHYQDAVCEHHEYVKDNAVPVVQSNVTSVANDAYMMILNDMHE
nr:integrase, catalytic region, zinc finger, CCHC-type, peptidase aspartic, catalytic [Tanacetum cinerariifolium]